MGGLFNVNKIHNSFQFMCQNVYLFLCVCNFTAVIHVTEVGKLLFYRECAESADVITTGNVR